MTTNYLPAITCGCFILLAFIVTVNFNNVNKIANRWLAVFLGCFAIILFNEQLINDKNEIHNAFYFTLLNTSFFILGPSLFFSVSYFVTPARVFKKKDLWHFTLIALITAFNFISWLTIDKADLENTANQNLSIGERIISILMSIIPISIYWFVSYKKLDKHKQHVLLYASSTETIDLAWLQKCILGLIIMIVAIATQSTIDAPIVKNLAYCAYLALAFYLAYYTIQQKSIFGEKEETNLEIQTIIEEDDEPDTHRKQVLSNEEINQLKPKLAKLMESDKPYLDSELSLSDLSAKMSMSSYELSYLLNTGFENNFYNFINAYRVEESKMLLISPKHDYLSILGIAFESGFNSKTAFNTAFKKITGQAPTVYKSLNRPQ